MKNVDAKKDEPAPAGSVERLVSLLDWEYQPDHEPRRWRGYLKGHPETTLFLLNLCEDRDDRCNLLGAVIPDDEDGKGLNSRCLIQWARFAAEEYLRDFMQTVRAAEANSLLNEPGSD